MDRRRFIAASATGAAVAASAEALSAGAAQAAGPTRFARLAKPTSRSQRPQPAVLSGLLVQPNPHHPHLMVLVAHPDHAQPLGATTEDPGRIAIWVHPKDLRHMPVGQRVTLAGQLSFGRFQDINSGFVARAVLSDAKVV